MRPQQLLALCLLAGVACSVAVAAQARPQGEYYDEDPYGYGGPPPPPYPPPSCTCDTYKAYDDEGAVPPCVDCATGTAVKYDPNTCKTTSKTSWCQQVPAPYPAYESYGYAKPEPGYWACKYNYTAADTTCSDGDGNCEEGPGVCTGDSPACKYNLTAAHTECEPDYDYGYHPEGECWNTPKCDGRNPKCPPYSHAPNGHPCGPDGLYEEAYMASGELAQVSAVPMGHAKEHHWDVCHRCWHGKCQPFNYEWWTKTKTHGHTDPEEDYYGHSTSDYTKDGYLKHQYSEDEYYPTKVEVMGKHGVEPEFFCHRPYDRY